MAAPVFEEFDPESDCECPGCAQWRPVPPRYAPGGTAGSPVPHRALVLAAAAGTVLAAGHPAPAAAHAPSRPAAPAADEPDTPQGGEAPLHGPGGLPAKVEAPATTRAEIIERAKEWVAARVPYSMGEYWSDGYRQDCSGFVSMAWNLGGNEWTGSLGKYGVRISKSQLQSGDMLLFHNPADPQKGSHVVIFGGWTDSTRSYYTAYEQTRPHARRQSTPYAYWSHSDRYLAYRYKGVTTGAGGAGPADPTLPGAPGTPTSVRHPGAAAFGPGADNAHVTRLGRMLVARGAGAYYTTGPGPRWTEADRRATRAFQRAQGWTGADADGLPGPFTWSYLVQGKGRDVVARSGGGAGAPAAPPDAQPAPAYPGRAAFRPGASGAHVTRLGRQLVRKGFGAHYTRGPGPRWGEGDRRNVEAFQRAQGWRGAAADGYPGPETWRRLFS
ncbi:peptidoglycan-binding protein [Streptomyces fructofermentans]|nr:peptidoglycan-binding protein [Streptomyces fructofermentans]